MGKIIKSFIPLICIAFILIIVSSCGRSRTSKLLLQKKWEVYDVTPPAGIFNIEDNNRADDLKNGFYKGAWFRFLPDSIFIGCFQGKADTGKYHISRNGKTISLYPRHGGTMYEQIQIQQLTPSKLEFKTVLADFHMVLHLKTAK